MTLPLPRKRIGEQPQPRRRFLGTTYRRRKRVALMLIDGQLKPQTVTELGASIAGKEAEARDATPERLALAALWRRER